MKLYKFRSLGNCKDLERIEDIITKGFHCSNFFDFNDMNEGVYAKQINKKPKLEITLDKKLEYKICSFSEEGALESKLMWGHYANAGMGVVIEVEVDDNCKNIEKVVYEEQILNSNCADIKKILTHKTTEWGYENEFRYIEEGGQEKINIGKITGICFGKPYEHLKNFPEIKEKHTKLKEYLKYREKLKDFCKCEDIPKIECKNYPFE